MAFLARSPVLLLPYRLETRFGEDAEGSPELWVRLFPDQLSVTSHETKLTKSEVVAGELYWDALWRLGTGSDADERPPWQALSAASGPQRAAWIARDTRPENWDQRPTAKTPDDQEPQPKPAFRERPPDELRASSWEEPARASGLPDSWVVFAYSGPGEPLVAEGSKVDKGLHLGPDPGAAVTVADNELQVEKGMRWMVDFDAAVAAGMALRIPLTDEQRRTGFDRVVALGLSSSPDPSGAVPRAVSDQPGWGGAVLQALLEAHHYTDGLAFLPQGTPTNNTGDAPAGWSRRDAGAERSFAVERGPALELGDAAVAAGALGVDAQTFEHVEHADRHDQAAARAMATVLWPATLGYYLRHLMADVFTPEQQEQARRYFLDHVRPRGPLPAFRVGDVPYGVLPATSLDAWNQPDASAVEQGLVDFLKRMRPLWLRCAEKSPRVRRTPAGQTADSDLVGTLGMDASAQCYALRPVVGEEFLTADAGFFDISIQYGSLASVEAAGRDLLDRYGYQQWDPRVLRLQPFEDAFEAPYPAVQEPPLSDDHPLADLVEVGSVKLNYIEWLRKAKVDELWWEQYPGGNPPRALLYRLLRHSLLRAYSNLALDWLVADGEITAEQTREEELVGFPDSQGVTPRDALDRHLGDSTQTIAQMIDSALEQAGPPSVIGTRGRVGDPLSPLHELRVSLELLATLPSAELERLLGETLDAVSHRFDAWMTSVATSLMHRSPGGGIHLGAFTFVEDLRPDPERGDNQGFVHAPSLPQAAAAAVLRNGYVTHRDRSEGKLLALDLSSERVRLVLWLIDGVRQGQSLGALLGYRFESELHRRGLDRYVQAFRSAYPLVANKLTRPAEPAEAVAAPNVVDGHALHLAWKARRVNWRAPGMPPQDSQREGVESALADLADLVDALGDVSIAESVYQIVRGGYDRASGLLDAVSRGERAPDPQIVDTPRRGLDVVHRLALLLIGTPARSANWAGAALPRASAEPRLDAWLSQVLPNPQAVACRVKYRDAAGATHYRRTTLSELGLGPLEVLELTTAADQPQASELEQRILYRALEVLPGQASELELEFGGQGLQPGDLTFPEFLVAARAARDLVTAARPLGPQDLAEPELTVDEAAALDAGNARLDARAKQAYQHIDGAGKALENAIAAAKLAAPATVDALRDRLFEAGRFGVSGAVPERWHHPDQASLDRLLEQAAPVIRELKERRDRALAADSGFDSGQATPSELREHLVGMLQEIFGGSFVVLPEFRPPNGDSLASALGQSAAMLAGDVLAPARWVQQLTHVRAGVARWDHVHTLGQLLAGTQPPRLTLGQLPHQANDRWLGLPLDPAHPPTPGRIALAVELSAAYDKTLWHSGLLLDGWTERIASPEETTGVAFHYDQPTNQAPQSLLLAYCPDDRERWDHDTLAAIVNQTIDLAKIRTVEPDRLEEVGQILPALYLTFNADGSAPTDPAGWME